LSAPALLRPQQMMLEITAAWQFITGVADASRARGRRATASSWRTLPQEKRPQERPRVDGARIPPNTSVMAPCRRTSTSSMLSAPAAPHGGELQPKLQPFLSSRSPVF